MSNIHMVVTLDRYFATPPLRGQYKLAHVTMPADNRPGLIFSRLRQFDSSVEGQKSQFNTSSNGAKY